MDKVIRNSKFEILKILCILMVIVLHYNNYGGALWVNDLPFWNKFVVFGTESLSIVAVNVFVLISGFYLVEKKSFKVRKCINLIITMIFYGAIIFLLCMHFGILEMNENTKDMLLNELFSRWFIVIYLILYILSPFINMIINNISKNNYRFLLVILFLFFSVWPSIFNTYTVNDCGYGIINFVFLYLAGGYIKKYMNSFNHKSIIIVYLICQAVTCYLFRNNPDVLFYNFSFNIIGSIALFLFFHSFKDFSCNLISGVAKHTLGIYMIHECAFVREYIFKNIFLSTKYYYLNSLIFNLLTSCIVVFVVCLVIDIVREFVFKYTIYKVFDHFKILNKEIVIGK